MWGVRCEMFRDWWLGESLPLVRTALLSTPSCRNHGRALCRQGKRGVGEQVQLARLGAGQQQGPHHLGVEPPKACWRVWVVDKVLGPLKDYPHLLQVL